MKYFVAILISVSILSSCKEECKIDCIELKPGPQNEKFIKGLDLSFTPMLEEYGTKFYINGKYDDILQIARSKGINTIRVRIWNNPSDKHSSLAEVAEFAKRIKAKRLRFWLDFHYSDTWADPGHQDKPKAWQGLNLNTLNDSLYQYTKSVLSYLIQQNAIPEFVQIGNEINQGLLWDEGKIKDPKDNSDNNWFNMVAMLKLGVKAVRQSSPQTKIIIHIAGYDVAEDYFSKLQRDSLDYDIIGLSYYPWWHGKSIDSLKQSIISLESRYNKPILIAETAYPFSFGWNDYTNNIVGDSSQTINEYPASKSGQAAFISDLSRLCQRRINSGLCYWAPDWVAYKSNTATDASTWENLALFDFLNNATPALDSLGKDYK
jgi:arabinogalactan endo-1,4-beta-galactosidase